MIKKLLFFSIVCILFTFSYLFFKQKVSKKIINIGMMSGRAPYMNINKNGDMEGFDVDIARELEGVTGYQVSVKDCGSLSSLLVALDQGSLDIIMSGLDITNTRRLHYDTIKYSDAYKLVNFYCITNAKDYDLIKDNIDSYSFSIGVEGGSSFEPGLDKYKNITRKYFPSVGEMVLQLAEDSIDCFIIEKVHTQKILKEGEEFRAFSVPLEPDYKLDGIGLLIKKGNKELYKIIDDTVQILVNNGIIAFLEQKWGLQES